MSFPRYPEYKDSGIEWLGEIPRDWVVNRLKAASHVIPSNVDKHSKTDEEPVRLCNYTDVYYNDRITSNLKFMSATASSAEVAKFALAPGDVVITKDSETADDIAVPAFVAESLPGVICGYHLAIIRPRQGTYGRYLHYLFHARYLRSYFEVQARGLTRVGISQSALSNAPIPRPQFEEQRTIADFLDHETAKIDALIEEQQRLIELLEEKRQAVISHAVTKGLDPDAPMKDSGMDWLGEVPAHWDVVKIKRVAKLESGHTPSKSVLEYWENCSVPWVSLNDSKTLAVQDYIEDTRHKINEAGLANSSAHILPAETVVFTRDATIGLAAITKKPMAVSQHLIGWVCGPSMSPEYLLLVLYAMEQELHRATFGATIKTIGMPEVNKMVTPVPPMKEQAAIVKHVFDKRQQLSKMRLEAEKAVMLLKERRSALISAAVTGKIDVRNRQPRADSAEDFPMAAEESATYETSEP